MRVLAVLLAAAALAAPGGAADPWKALRRPLHIPRLAAGELCPVTPAASVSPDFGRAQGPGPVHPVGAADALHFIYPVRPEQGWYPSQWSGNKILWIARPEYRGPVLIRGRQLDGPNILRFGGHGSGLPLKEMRLFPVGGTSRSGWQHRPSYTRVRAAGCYAWQVDGSAFSLVIVFRAVRSR